MVGLEERHHTFLQALMRRGPLSEKESKNMFRALFESSNDKFFEFISTMNKELDFVHMEVRGSANQYDGTVFYGLVNKLASEEAKLGTLFTHAQLTFFKAIMESILVDSSARGVISSMEALNLRLDSQADSQSQGGASTSQAAPVRLTLAAKEDTLASLVADKWLSRTEDGRVALGIKSFVELRNLFKNFDIPFCDVCNEAAIKARLCQNEDCNVRMHAYCVPRKFSRQQVAKVCPGCGTAWKMQSLTPASRGAVSIEDEETPPTDRNIYIDNVDEDNHLENGNIGTQFEEDNDAQESPEDIPERPARRIVSRAKVKANRYPNRSQ